MAEKLLLLDGRQSCYQWDTNVQVELRNCVADELHFNTSEGLIKRTLVDNICTIPDIVLQEPGEICVYAYTVASERYTKCNLRLNVLARPRPIDYIEPTSEMDIIDSIIERLTADESFITAVAEAIHSIV